MPARKLLHRLAAITATLGLAAAACQAPASPTHPTLLIGLDGLEWNVVLELLRERRVPTLARLIRTGSYGELRSMRPTMSPIIWTSIATSKPRRAHGIHGFVKKRRKGEAGPVYRLYSSRDRKTKAFWNILTERGKRVSTVGWWNTYPVEPISGVMVAQVNTTSLGEKAKGQGIWKGSLIEGLPDQIHPSERQSELLEVLPQAEAALPAIEARVLGHGDRVASLGALEQKLWEQSRWSFRADAVYARLAERLLAEDDGRFDVFAVYFGGADVSAHRFWRYMDPKPYQTKPDPAQRDMLADVVRNYIIYLDEVVAELIAAAGGDQVNVIIVGDHGMAPTNLKSQFKVSDPAARVISAAHQKAPPGVFIASGPDIRTAKGERDPATLKRKDLGPIGGVLDVTPTLLALAGVPVARDFAGTVLTGVLRDDFLARVPTTYVETYDEPGWAASRKEAAGDTDVEERLEQLRALGYLQ